MLTRFHAYVGLVLLLPLAIWGITGLVFLFQPGYQAAFAPLEVKALPLKKSFVLPAAAQWQEARYLRTLLGWHLLVKDDEGVAQHLHPQTLKPWPLPILEMAKKLLAQSVAHDPDRYGDIQQIILDGQDYFATTTTGIELKLNWTTLQVRQSGSDTRFINRLYRLHYMQWTPNPILNKALAAITILLLLTMTAISLRMLITVYKWE